MRLGPHGLQTGSALNGADRRSLWMAPEFGAGRFVSRCSERDNSAAWKHLAGSKVEPRPVMAAGQCAGRGPTRAPDSGDTFLWVVAVALPHWIYKRTGRGAVRVVVVVRVSRS